MQLEAFFTDECFFFYLSLCDTILGMSEPKRWEVKSFQTSRGSVPVEDFIREQDKVTYSKILSLIILLRDNGPFLKSPQAKKIQSNLYELRTKGRNSVRIFYTFSKETYYLLHAFKKKSQKTPARELKTAIDRMEEII
jgi:phage-related protein